MVGMKKYVVVSAFIMGTSAVPAAAAVVGDGTPGSCNEAAFTAAMNSIRLTGGSVTFNCGGPATINLTSEKLLYNPGNQAAVYTIDGGGLITLNGQGVTRHILHLSGTLNVSNITFTNGLAQGAADAASGGAIRSDRNPAVVSAPVFLNLGNVTFTNNVSNLTSFSPPFHAFDYGGAAVFGRLVHVSVSNCQFSGNHANNSAGGALHGRSSAWTIASSVFTANTSNGGGFGGAIHVDGVTPAASPGALNISGTSFSGNTAWNQGGGVFAFLYAGEQLLLDAVNFLGNAVVDSGQVDFVGTQGLGGGLTVNRGLVTIRNSTFANNAVRGQVSTNGRGIGGGGEITSSETLTILNSTFSGNVAFGGTDSLAGALHIGGNLQPFQIVHSTIVNNQAGQVGGGIFSGTDGVLTNTVVANNSAPIASQCAAQLSNGGGTLQFPDTSPRCTPTAIIANPQLGPLAANGGCTSTHHPQPGSPVINAVSCAASTDQRGFTRPQGGACEIGSVEVACSALSVTPLTLPTGRIGVAYSQVFTLSGGANPVSMSLAGALPTGLTFNSGTRTLSGTPTQSGAFVITINSSDAFTCAASRTYNLAIASAVAMNPVALAVDAAANGVLEVNETVVVAPSWRNQTGVAAALSGTASSFIGRAGATYSIVDGTASYGTIANNATVSCTATGNCYSMAIGATTRPEAHWDPSFVESVSTGGPKAWALHVGGSFSDVPASNPFYRFVEILLHRSVTGGCGGSSYCRASATTREQMSVFVLVAREGPTYLPPACAPPNTFADVPETSPFCRWIEELERRGVVSGCGGPNYCPSGAVTREQMAIFALRTLDPALNPPACTTPMFNDVPAASAFCRWIEELARRGVVSGCGGGNYCPASPVTREQMGVFLSATFGLTLYGP
jgi:putative Ig domain-containing protein/S-layer family protein